MTPSPVTRRLAAALCLAMPFVPLLAEADSAPVDPSTLDGKILVDVSNATERTEGGPGPLVYPGSSLAEHLQEALPDTRVVKTLNTMLFMVMTAPGSLSHPATAFLSGDDADAKATVLGLLADLGWPAEQVLDLGGVATARGPEALILLVPDVLRARGFAPVAISIVS